MAVVTIVPSVLRQQVEEGWKLKPLAEHYGLPASQMKKALQAQGLTIRKFHNPKFVFAEEATEQEVEAQEVTDINETLETENSVEEVVEAPIEETTATEQPTVSQMGDW